MDKKILTAGTIIETRVGKISETIIGVCIRGQNTDSIEYNISYFINGERKTDWVFDFELTEKIDNKVAAGFYKPKSNHPLIDKP